MPTNDSIPEAIRLQLRKPKSWQWELSTSKSSPHIVLPVIQLFDCKGELLLETRDQGKTKRKTWQSSASIPSVRRTASQGNFIENADSAIQQNVGFEILSRKNDRCHQRSKSDDLYKRKLRYNSRDESIKRAEMDGYRTFITASMPENERQKHATHRGADKREIEEKNVDAKMDRRLIEMVHISPKKYTTRTSKAGTLVIPQDSVRETTEKKVNNRLRSTRKRRNHAKRSSTERNQSYNEDKLKGVDRVEIQRRLFYSQSDSFPMEKQFDSDIFDENHNYQVSDSDDWNFQAIRKSSRRRRKRRSRKGTDKEGHLIKDHSAQQPKETDGGETQPAHDPEVGTGDLLRLVRRLSLTPSDLALSTAHHTHPAHAHSAHAHSTHARPAHAQPAHAHSTAAHAHSDGREAAASPDALGMGANVSRHSAKGLSGRRSQSSGSICNGGGSGGGKGGGRHAEGKICSSLPSYLDDGEKGQDDGEQQEKAGIDEVDRLSSLGDGAPFHWKFSEGVGHPLCDQGYGSERSPEEEYPPPLPDHNRLHTCHHHLEPHQCYPFITPESTFHVKLCKGSRGLGLSVTGGIDGGGPWPGLVRVKRLFPHQPASACGLLAVGDLLLEANGVPLTGLTNYEALEVLRTAANQVSLKVCRPPPDVLNCVSPISEVPPPPPRREPPNSLDLPGNVYNTTPEDEYYRGEFEITLNKIQGSLGFTLRKEDDSALGHYVRALVREPALADGRIRAGDKIVAVNDTELFPMTHEQAVQFLRGCPDVVKLRLYRDTAQTPVATLSPSETTPRNSFSRKANLRQEAVDMLNDIAGRRLVDAHQSPSPESSLRRPRRPARPSDPGGVPRCEHDHFHEQFLRQCAHRPFDDVAFDSLFTSEPEEEEEGGGGGDGGDGPARPASLDLYNPNQTPVACRKPRFNFSLAHNAYELNNLDAEVLDAPNLTYNLGNEETATEHPVQEPVSMPHIPTNNATFSYKNPAYQSAHPQMESEPIEPAKAAPKAADNGTLKRRKSEREEERDAKPGERARRMPIKEEYEVLAIELNRGWNSRLGFSLQGAAGVTYVSAVHADSVAAKDGRLKPGDRLIKVNDESIEHMTTCEIIELLRILRGPVCIVISRLKSNE